MGLTIQIFRYCSYNINEALFFVTYVLCLNLLIFFCFCFCFRIYRLLFCFFFSLLLFPLFVIVFFVWLFYFKNSWTAQEHCPVTVQQFVVLQISFVTVRIVFNIQPFIVKFIMVVRWHLKSMVITMGIGLYTAIQVIFVLFTVDHHQHVHIYMVIV